jgi:hypothetical protein
MPSIAETLADDPAWSRRLLDEAQVVTAGLDDLGATLSVE